MLSTIKIQNIALIPSVEIVFGEHFNVLTGETGAGKSIVIGSLNFILGDKLSASVIRQGADYARVTAVFYKNCKKPSYKQEMQGEQGVSEGVCPTQITERMTQFNAASRSLDDGDETIITRTMWQNGRSEIRINDDIVTIKTLREVTGGIIDIHGQHDTERLLTPKNHIDILDSYGRVNLTAYKAEYDKLKSLERELAEFGDNDTERERLIDLYRYQIDEIEKANLSAAEETELEQRITIMRNAGKVTESLGETISNLNTADTDIAHAVKKLSAVTVLDANLNTYAERLNAVQNELTDIIIGTKEYLSGADYTDADIDAVGERLDEIKNLKRKYGKTVDEIFSFLNKTKSEYERLAGAAEKIAELRGEIKSQSAAVQTAGEALSAVRRETAARMQSELLVHLAELGMPNAQFTVQFNKETGTAADESGEPAAYRFHPNGIDETEFFFSANLGEAVKPLSKIISGGEMSRLMLCIKTIANADRNKTLVFDEIDTGISGLMGAAVANKLSVLSKHSQIIAVTHLAPIAAAADTHFLIEKSVANNKTTTAVLPLTDEQRVAEIGRIIGGGETAIAHAKTLLSPHPQR
jgi:DNA repair protein RecN (Recombination protein N)